MGALRVAVIFFRKTSPVMLCLQVLCSRFSLEALQRTLRWTAAKAMGYTYPSSFKRRLDIAIIGFSTSILRPFVIYIVSCILRIYITYILRMHVYVIPNTNVPCALYVGQKGPNTLLRRPFMFL